MKKPAMLFLVFIAVSCNNENNIPSGIIRPDKMQHIFGDMIKGDLLAQEIIKKDSTQTLKSAGLTITKKIFAIDNIDSEQFKKSVAFYERHPALLKVIFDSLSAIQTRNTSPEFEKKDRFEKREKLIRNFPHTNRIP